jgi:hypothetical protein
MAYKSVFDKEKDKPDAAIGSTYASPDNSKGSDLSELLKNSPTYTKGAYTPKYQDQANTALKEYLNYDPFEYDVNADKLYQQAVDLYTERGRLASEDAMGQAAALTGGYGNSYAATAGSQAYQQYMQELSAMAPEFEQRAYEKYLQGKSDAYDKYAALQGAEDSNYAKYLDEENRNYSRYRDDVADYENSIKTYLKNKEIKTEGEDDSVPAVSTATTDMIIAAIPTKEQYASGDYYDSATDLFSKTTKNKFSLDATKAAKSGLKDSKDYSVFVRDYLESLWDRGALSEGELLTLLDNYGIKA